MKDFKSIFKPLSQDQIAETIKLMSQNEKNKRLKPAIEESNVSLVKLLIDNGADINIKYNNYWDLILWTINNTDSKEIIELLINAGANIEAKDNNNWTPIMYASYRGLKDVVELLIKAGANINIKSVNGKTALMRAKEYDHKDVVKLLKQYGATE